MLLAACGGDNKNDGTDTEQTGYSVNGVVTGLTSGGLLLRNNGSDDLAIDADGGFKFATELNNGAVYEVTIITQPVGQICTVANGSGVLAGADVTDVAISCALSTYRIGGSVSGLTGNGLVLQNNGGDDLSVESDGSFHFAAELPHGSHYAVTIAAQPGGQGCVVRQGEGALAGNDVADVLISCPPEAVTPTVSAAGQKLLRFSWNDVGADHYKLLKNPDGNSGYGQVGEPVMATTVDEEISVHLTDWVNAGYMVQACNAAGDCTDSPVVSISSLMLDVIGYLKAPYLGQPRASVDFGTRIALSGDGMTLVVADPREESAATGINGDPENNTWDAYYSGAVNVFVREGGGWTEQAYIKSPVNSYQAFGKAISLSDDGNTLAVCVQNGDLSSILDTVYLYIRNGTTWSQQAYLELSESYFETGFCEDVALSGNGDLLGVTVGKKRTLIPTNHNTGINKVRLYERSGSVWSMQAVLEASHGEEGDSFGATLRISSDGATLAASAHEEDSAARGINGDQANNDAYHSGAVYVFAFDGDTWTEQAYVKASNSERGDLFGMDIALSANGDTLAVTALFEDSSATGVNGDQADNSRGESGAVYLFEREGADWEQSAYIKALNTDREDLLGSVALSADGNYMAVTAHGEASLARGINGDQTDNSGMNAPPGAVYLFTRHDSVWSQHAYIKASNTDAGYETGACVMIYCSSANDDFGSSIALSGDGSTLVVGASGENSGDPDNQEDDSLPGAGAIYTY